MTGLLLAVLVTAAQPSSPPVTGVVTDMTGAPLAGATITMTTEARRESVKTQADGSFSIAVPNGSAKVTLRADAPGFAPIDRAVTVPSEPIRFELRPEAVAERITVSGEPRAPRLALDTSATTMDASAIASAPALRLDDQLRVVPGFSLFRRTTSAVANPTTQGVTLRGLSASGASRTVVLADDVPLNDPFGGWVYWDRVPMASLERVDVARGASGDLHGNDALGGVIRLTSRTRRGAEAWFDGGSLGTARGSLYAGASRDNWLAGAAFERGTTNGFIVTAPEARGPIDIPATSDSTSADAWGGANAGSVQATVRGGYFDENRNNGTPAQINATVTRWGAAAAHGFVGGGVWEARGDGSFTDYRQTFSAVTTVNGVARAGERLTNLQWVGSSGIDAGASWIKQTSRAQGLVAFTLKRMRANLDEASFTTAGVESAITRTPPNQLGDGLVFQGRFDVDSRVAIDGGVRGEHWRLERTDTGAGHSYNFVAPRIGVSVDVATDQTLRIDWLTGFRTPTMNELYRSFRVGNTNTLANDALKPETSWGPELAYTFRRETWTGRAIAYYTTLNGAIFNKTLSSANGAITRQRSNGDARTFGSELEFEYRAFRAVSLTTSWALNDSKFTAGELDGKRVPQVPRASGSVGARAAYGRFTGAATIRIIGAQFDDDVNLFKLDRGSLADARAAWRLSKWVDAFAAIENAFDEEIDTGKTPIRTIGPPRAARAGVTVHY
jgi:outer membrane receptor protein involved in Fe transport